MAAGVVSSEGRNPCRKARRSPRQRWGQVLQGPGVLLQACHAHRPIHFSICCNGAPCLRCRSTLRRCATRCHLVACGGDIGRECVGGGQNPLTGRARAGGPGSPARVRQLHGGFMRPQCLRPHTAGATAQLTCSVSSGHSSFKNWCTCRPTEGQGLLMRSMCQWRASQTQRPGIIAAVKKKCISCSGNQVKAAAASEQAHRFRFGDPQAARLGQRCLVGIFHPAQQRCDMPAADQHHEAPAPNRPIPHCSGFHAASALSSGSISLLGSLGRHRSLRITVLRLQLQAGPGSEPVECSCPRDSWLAPAARPQNACWLLRSASACWEERHLRRLLINFKLIIQGAAAQSSGACPADHPRGSSWKEPGRGALLRQRSGRQGVCRQASRHPRAA